jgi:hypothetical protein
MEPEDSRPDIILKPDTVGSARCTVGKKYHMFDKRFGDAPCTNCGRDFCHDHAAKEISTMCAPCGKAYLAEGAKGLKRIRKSVHRGHNS